MKRNMPALGAIQRIATLGHPPELALHALMAALHDVVPHEKSAFLWVDAEGNDRDWEGTQQAVPEHVFHYYLERYFNRLETQVIPSTKELIGRLGTDRSATIEDFHDTEFFNIIIRPGDNRHYMRVAVRDGIRPVGVFILLRPPGSRDFTREDEQRLAGAAPWIAQALSAPRREPSAEGKLVESASGLILADENGNPQYFSEGARTLLHRVTGTPINLSTVSDRAFHWARPLIGKLLQALTAASGRHSASPVPALTIRNEAGLFVLRAYWLGALEGGRSQVVIQIQRQVPLLLRLMESPLLRKLPPREQQACLLLAEGLSSSQVAQHMGISRDGPVYHIRSLYNRFCLANREELIEALLKRET